MKERVVAVFIVMVVVVSFLVIYLSVFQPMDDISPTESDVTTTTVEDTGNDVNPFPFDETGYQFEKSVYFLTPGRIFFRVSADDANISISFSDQSDLLYSINVIPYPDSTEAGIMFVVHTDSWGVIFGAGRQETIDIVLGTHSFYFIYMVDNSNLNTTITYSNNAWVNGSAFQYSDEDCDLNLRICDDIRATDSIGFTGTISCRTLNLKIQVPTEWKGFVDFNESNVTVVEMFDWTEFASNMFRTFEDNEEYLSIELNVAVEEAYARILP